MHTIKTYIYICISPSLRWLKYFITFLDSTAPGRKECCKDLKPKTSNMGNPKHQPEFWSSLPPTVSLIFKKNATMAQDVRIITEGQKHLTAIPKLSKEHHWPCCLDFWIITVTAVTKPQTEPISLMWVSLIKALGSIVNKKSVQFREQVAKRQHLVLQGNSKPTPSHTFLTGHSVHLDHKSLQRSKYKLHLQQSHQAGRKALDIRNSIYTTLCGSRSPKEKQAGNLTKSMLPELLYLVCTVPQRLCMPKSALFFLLFSKPKMLSLMDLVSPYDL